MAEDGLPPPFPPKPPPSICLVPPREDPPPHRPTTIRTHPSRPIRGARGPERGGPTRSHPEPGRDPPQRRRVLWGCPTGGEAAASPPDRSDRIGTVQIEFARHAGWSSGSSLGS